METSKKMTIKEFVDAYTKAKSDIEKNKVLKNIAIKKYVPYSTKVIHSQIVLERASKRVNGVLLSDSTMRYLSYVISIIRLYTDLVIDPEMPNNDYDLLRESDLIDVIFERIGNDVAEFSTVFDMVWDDMVNNENDFRVFIASQVANFANICKDTLENKEFVDNLKALATIVGKQANMKK